MQENIKILLICDNQADIVNIKARMESHDGIPCHVWQYPTLSDGIGYLDMKKLRADIIILDLGLKGVEMPKEIYRQMKISAHDIPIIVITGKGAEEHDLAVFVMETGAADNMIRGEFIGLTDAIEFALIRRKLANDKKTNTDKELQDCKDDGDAENLKDRQDHQDNLSMFMTGYSATGQGLNDDKKTE